MFRPKPPSVLYKYFPPERIDVLQNGKLRFTQPLVFNDPFESLPAFSRLAPKKEMERASKIEAARTGVPEEDRQRIFDFIFAESGGRELEPFEAHLLLGTLARGVGVLSLTEKADNLLMWAHYSRCHEGFVVGFRTRDPFLSRPDARRDAVHDLRKVRYTTRRPKLRYLTKLGLVETYFTKSTEWEYEQEWRMYTVLPEEDTRDALVNGLRSIVETGTVGEQLACPLRLFDFPASCVDRIIVGCRASDQTRADIVAIVNAKYPSAKIIRAETDASEFRLVLKSTKEEPRH